MLLLGAHSQRPGTLRDKGPEAGQAVLIAGSRQNNQNVDRTDKANAEEIETGKFTRP